MSIGYDYHVGQSTTLEFVFVDEDEQPSDPATVTVRVGVYVSERTVQTLATYNTVDLIHTAGTGLYQKVYRWTRQGKHIVEAVTTGEPTTTETEVFDVGPQPTWLP